MKAGVYKTPNDNLIYVAKDRTIKAASLSPSSWPGTKVSHRAKDDTVRIEGTSYRCTRHADVPNGCTDHQALVDSMHMAANLEPGQRVVDYGTKFARVEEIDGTPDGITEDGNAIDLKTTADDPYKRMAEHMRGCEKAMRHVGEAATGAAEALMDNSEQARKQLRSMPQTRDAVLHLLLIEAGLAFQDGVLVKTANVQANLGMKPEYALARVIAKHLRLE